MPRRDGDGIRSVLCLVQVLGVQQPVGALATDVGVHGDAIAIRDGELALSAPGTFHGQVRPQRAIRTRAVKHKPESHWTIPFIHPFMSEDGLLSSTWFCLVKVPVRSTLPYIALANYIPSKCYRKQTMRVSQGALAQSLTSCADPGPAGQAASSV